MAQKHTPFAAEILLGECIRELRVRKGLTQLQLGRQINETEQQIEKFEKGVFVPLGTLEKMALALGGFIPKRLIRRISSLRKKEISSGIEQEELSELYREALMETDTPGR